jgi:hypothetical protein
MSADPKRKLVLVTGAPRSGTTALGRMLALAAGCRALHEPLNFHVGLRAIERYYEIPGTAGFSPERVDGVVRDIRRLRLRYKRGTFPEDRGLKRLLKYAFGGRAVNSYRLCRLHPRLLTIIWKDPFAAFFAERLALEHDVDVLVAVRNARAVAGSFKRMRWAFDLADIFTRMETVGLAAPAGWRSWRDQLDTPAINAALLWSAVNSHLYGRATAAARIRFVDLESIVTEPARSYRELYRVLGLPWSGRVGRAIERAYSRRARSGVPRSGKAHDQDRDLRQVNVYWRAVLEPREVEVVDRLTADVQTLMREVTKGDAAARPEPRAL